MKTAEFVQNEIKKAGGLNSFSSAERKNRSIGCPMKNALSLNHGWNDAEAMKLSKEELHVGFLTGAIKNNSSN